jgi:hypothetical protein
LLHLWPWLGRTRVPFAIVAAKPVEHRRTRVPRPVNDGQRRGSAHPGIRGGTFEHALRRVAKPLVRRLLVARADAEHRARRVVRDPRGH